MVQHRGIDERRLGETGTPMEDAMPDGDGLFTAEMRPHPVDEIAEQGLVIRFVPAWPGFLNYDPAVRVLGDQVRHRADALDLACQEQGRFLLIHRGIARELDAR